MAASASITNLVTNPATALHHYRGLNYADWSVPAKALRDAMFDSAQDLERLLERRGDVDILGLYRVLVNE